MAHTRPKPAEWYVIQVQTGLEQDMCQTIESACRTATQLSSTGTVYLEECFAPRYATQRKYRGEWVDEERLLLQGYVIAVTNDPWELVRVLRKVPRFTHVLAMGKTLVPLGSDDRAWIERWTKQGDRVIPMSIAYKEYKEGDRIVVVEGPLKGQEALIDRINRRKSVAHLTIHAGQMTIRATVGLAVLPDGAGKMSASVMA